MLADLKRGDQSAWLPKLRTQRLYDLLDYDGLEQIDPRRQDDRAVSRTATAP
jgi:hypothetical protein